MPFTISHAAVVVPVTRLLARWRLLSAVTIGAMAPDFGIFLPWRMHRIETHSAVGLVTFCLPVGLATYWVVQHLIKTPVLELLPDGPYARWRPFASPADPSSALQWLLAGFGVLAGAVTHLVWDAFTHDGARGVRMIPWLEDPIVEIGNHHMVGVRFMQDVSSLVGLAIVGGWIMFELRRGSGVLVTHRLLRRPERRLWIALYLLAALAMSLAWYVLARSADPAIRSNHSVTTLVGSIAIASLRGFASALVAVSLGLDTRLRALHLRRTAPEPPAADS